MGTASTLEIHHQNSEGEVKVPPRRRQNAAPQAERSLELSRECRDSSWLRDAAEERPTADGPMHARDLRDLVLMMRLPLTPLGPKAGRLEVPGVGSSWHVRVEPVDPGLPVASGSQANVVTWIASALMREVNLYREVPTVLTVSTRTLLSILGRGGGGSQRKWLLNACRACANTQVTLSGREQADFRLIDRVEERPGGYLRIWLNPWIEGEVLRRRVLQIDPAALELAPIDRRLYWLACSGVGRSEGDGRVMSFYDVFDRSGSIDAPRKFRAQLATAARRDCLPGYSITLDGRGSDMVVRFMKREKMAAPEPAKDDENVIYLHGFSDLNAADEEPLPEISFEDLCRG